jgi:hypothetical protein
VSSVAFEYLRPLQSIAASNVSIALAWLFWAASMSAPAPTQKPGRACNQCLKPLRIAVKRRIEHGFSHLIVFDDGFGLR